MQRRAQREALTPEKIKRNQSLIANSSLSLEEKKRKILKSLCRLEALAVLKPPRSENQILQMIAKVTDHKQTGNEAMFVHSELRFCILFVRYSQKPLNFIGYSPTASPPPAPGGGASEA